MQLAFAAAGAAIGSLAGPAGAQIGWMIGSLIGGLLDPPKVEGPRRTDKKLQRSEYGSAIPLIWGTRRVAGNVIWQPDEMTEHKHTSGGKGGPKQTTYTYSASWAVQLAGAKRFGEPAILSINKMWADGRLVSENGKPTDDFQFVVYTGTEDQEPDPTIEADKGAGNTPAYRGSAYVVFTDVTLTDFGDRIPSMEFEVTASGSGTLERICTFDTYLYNGSDLSDPLWYTGNPHPIPGCYLDGNELVVVVYDESPPSTTSSFYWEERYDIRTGERLRISNELTLPNTLLTTGITWITSSNSDLAVSKMRGTGTNGFEEIFWYKGGVKGTDVEPPAGETGGASAYYHAVGNRPVVGDGFVYAPANTEAGAGNRVRVYKWALGDGGFPNSVAEDDFFDYTSHSVIYSSPGAITAGNVCLTVDDQGFVYLLGSGGASYLCELMKIDPSDMTLVSQWFFNRNVDLQGDGSNQASPDANLNGRGFTVYRDLLCLAGEGSGTSSYSVQLFSLSSPGSPQALPWLDSLDNHQWGGWCDLGQGYVANNDGVFRIHAAETLGQVVEDISVIAGLSESDVDVSDLPDRVYGFMVASQMTAKNAIEALRHAYFFDGAEVDDVVLFKHRNHDSVATIPDDDLGAHESGTEAPPQIQITRAPDHELPARVNFTYIDPDMNYQANTVYDERQAGYSTANVSIDVPLVFPANIARSIASRHVFAALLEREQGTIWVSRKWEKLVPTDVVEVKEKLWRIVAKRYRTAGVVEFDLIPTHPAIYEQTEDEASGISGGGSNANGGGGSTSSIGYAKTKAFLMDMPSLYQSDPPFGFRMAGCPSTTGRWSGFSLYKSYDNSNYQQVASSGAADVMGYTSTGSSSPSASGTLSVGSPASTLQVTLIDSTAELSSCSDTDYAAGIINMFAVQRSDGLWNICQFQYATLISAGVYELSNIRQLSVDPLSVGLHATGDAFVLLPAVTVDAPESDLNVAIYYKAVTWGATLGSAEAILFTNTGENSEGYFNTVANNLPVFSCDYGSPSAPRAGLVPAPSATACANDYILSVHGWIANTGGTGGGGGPGTIQVKNEGVVVLDGVRTLNFVGTVVTALDAGTSPSDEATIAIHGAIQTEENGVSVDTNCTTINFADGLIATDAGYGTTQVVAAANMVVLAVAYSATTSVDLANYHNYARVVINVGVLTGNITLNLLNGTDGQVIIVRLKQDTVGGRTFTPGGSLRFSSSLPSPTLTTTANKIDRLAFEWFDGPGSPSGYADLVAINFGY